MAGSKKLPRYQKSALNKMLDVIKRADFQEDVKNIRAELDENRPVLNDRSRQLVSKYGLPRLCFVLIRDYILSNDFGPADGVPPPIFLLSYKDNYVGPEPYDVMPLNLFLKQYPTKRVAINLTGEIQKQDLLDFINNHWSLIESKLALIEPSRPGAVKLKQMDKVHAEVLRLREKKGLSYNQIAVRLGLSFNNVKQILYRTRHPGKK